MVATIALAGGTLYGVLRLSKYLTDRVKWPGRQIVHRQQVTLDRHSAFEERTRSVPPSDSVPLAGNTVYKEHRGRVAVTAEREQPDHSLIAASLSLGVTAAGAFTFVPLQLASVPLLIYMGIPSAQDSYAALRDEGKITAALAETMVLAVCLGGGTYLIGSLGFTLYHMGRAVRRHRQISAGKSKAWALPAYAHLQSSGAVTRVPIQTLEVGNVVVACCGEMIPADGVIVEGNALLKSFTLSQKTDGRVKRVGDTVSATDIVQVGRIAFRVTD